jgi:glutamate 5-kinase
LSKGITSAAGQFEMGDVVSIRDKNQVEFARGLAKVGSIQLKSASGVIVHRDDLVVL